MLKYQFDKNKREKFLNFWGIEEFSQWEAFSENIVLIFLRISGLKSNLNQVIINLLWQNLSEKKISLKKNYFSFSKDFFNQENTLLDPDPDFLELMKELDVLNFINFLPSNPLSRKKSPRWQWSKWMLLFFKNTLFVRDIEDLFKLEKQNNTGFSTKPFKPVEKKLLIKLSEGLQSSTNFDIDYSSSEIALLKQLQEEKLILFFFQLDETVKKVQLNLTINPAFWENQKLSFLLRPIELKENLTPVPLNNFILYLDKILFEKKTKTKLPFLDISCSQPEKINFLKELINHFENQEWTEKYLTSDFEEKIKLIVYSLNKTYSTVIKHLIKKLNSFPLAKNHLKLLLKEIVFKMDPYQFSNIKLNAIIVDFCSLGIFIFQESKWSINPEYINLYGSVSDQPKKNFPLVIDLDMSITVFKKDLNEKLLYYLSIFTKRKNYIYSSQFEIETRLSAFAWFLNFNANQILTFLQGKNKGKLTLEFQEYVKLFFQNCDFYRQESFIGLNTPSDVSYNQLKFYLLHEFKDKPNIIFDDQKKILIFLEKQEYIKFLKEIKQEVKKNNIKIFKI